VCSKYLDYKLKVSSLVAAGQSRNIYTELFVFVSITLYIVISRAGRLPRSTLH
jgi:hypothetical protein